MYCYNRLSVALQDYPTVRTAADLAEAIERSIRQGSFAAGEPLPPIRQLAEQVGLSAGTVASAYRVLNTRGLTASDRRRGTWVRELRKEDLAPVRQTIPVPAGVVDCSSGNPDPRLLPDPVPAVAGLAYEPAMYGSPVAHPGFIAEARRRLKRDGVPAEHATVTFGALDGIARMLASNLAPGDRVALEDPGWAALIDLVERLGYTAVPTAVDPEGPTTDGVWQSLAAGAKAIVVTARAQNPTGAAISKRRAGELREVFSRYPGRLVIEDDHACGLAEVALHPVVGPTGRYGFLRSLAKGYGPDLRLAVAAGDATTVARLESSVIAGAGWVSHLVQQLALALWQDPAVSSQLAAASSLYRQRRAALCAELAARGIDVAAPTGLNVWIPVGDEATAVSALLARGWLVAPGGRFRMVSGPAIRVTTAALDTDRAAECATAIAEASAAAASKGRHSGSGG
jgi:DNA-binding transcriptional MocR family regulator